MQINPSTQLDQKDQSFIDKKDENPMFGNFP